MPGRTVLLQEVKGVHGLSRSMGVISVCLLGDIQNWKSILHVLPFMLVGSRASGPFPGGRQPKPD